MTTCVNCSRPIPCGCPNPARADAALTSLFGLVCDHCDGYNDPGQTSCALCAMPLAAPAPAPARPVIPQVPAAPAVAAPAVAAPAVTPPSQAPAATPGPATRPGLAPTARPSGLNPTSQIPIAAAPLALTQSPPTPLPLSAAPVRPVQKSADSSSPFPAPVASSPSKRPSRSGPAMPIRLDQIAAPLALTRVVAAEGAVCARCGAGNPPEFRFCTECGMALKPLESAAARAPVLPVTPGKAAARVLRGDKLGQTLGIGMHATAGRAQGSLSFPGDPFLAALHCTLYFQQNRFFVRDEGSPSGTFVRLRDEEPLSPGDFFTIGDHLLRYVGPLPAEMHAADGTKILGCPRPPGGAVQLEEIHEGGVPGRNSVRLGPSLIIGRDDGCDLSFSGDPFVSGRHCNITIGAGGRARLRDLGSTNGTFRRLEPGSERELLRGDCIRIGSEVLQLVESSAPVLSR